MRFLAQVVGTITPPTDAAGNPLIPNPGGNPSAFVAGIIRGAIQFLLITAFIVALIWTIFAGFRFVFSGGDEKSISGAWSQIYWGLIGLFVVVGAFAIIRLVESFFGVNIVSGGFLLPRR